MSVYVYAGWDVDVIGDMSVTVTEDNGSTTTWTTTITAGMFNHDADMSSVVTGYTSFKSKVQSKLNAGAQFGSDPFSVTFTNNAYTISYTPGTFKMAFTSLSNPGHRMRRALGFHATVSGASTFTSTMIPYYLLESSMGAKSRDSGDYEPDEMVHVEEGNDGQTFGAMAPSSMPNYNDFVFTMEPEERTQKHKADSDSTSGARPWTWRHFLEHIRSHEPFLVRDDNKSSEKTVHRMRARAARSKPERVVDDYDDLWNWQFETFVMGRP